MNHQGLILAALESAIKDNNYNETKRILNCHGLKLDDNWTDYHMLIHAVRSKNINIVKLLLNHGCRLKKNSTINNFTPLHYAVELKEVEIAKLLLEHKADINSQESSNDQTPLHIAVGSQYHKMIKLLMQYDPDLCIKNKRNLTPLHLAFLKGFDYSIVELLLSTHQGALENSINEFGFSHFLICCSTDNVKLVEYFLKKGVNVNQSVGNDFIKWKGYTPLHIAAAFYKVDIIKLLLKYNADVNARELHGLTPLVLACQHNFPAYGKMINNIFNNLEKNESYDFKKAVKQMIEESKHVQVIELLLEKGADINVKDNYDNLLLFHASGVDGDGSIRNYMKQKKTELSLGNFDAVSEYIMDELLNNRNDLLKILFTKKIDLNVTNLRNKCSILHLLADGGNTVCNESLDMCRLLFDSGADVDAINEFGDTPLCLASAKGSTAMMKLLLEYGANPNFAVSETLMTPLHYVCKHNMSYLSGLLEKGDIVATADLPIEVFKNTHWEEINMLINKGADLNAKDGLGLTPLFYTIMSCESRSLKRLLKAGSDVNIQDNQGMTPLFVALKHHNFIAVGILLDYGADINITNNKNETVLEYLRILQQKALGLSFVIGQWENFYEFMESFKLFEMHIEKLNLMNRFISSDNLFYYDLLKQAYEKLDNSSQFVHLLHSDLIFFRSKGISDDFVLLFNEELARMSIIKIDNFTTLYDFLTKNSREIVKHVRNENLKDYLEGGRFRSEFSIFSFALNLKFREGIARYKLIESAKETLRSHIKVNIPELCYDKILIYLSNEELVKCAL